MRRLMAVAAVGLSLAGQLLADSAASGELHVVLKPEKSVLWQTACANELTLPVAWPADAATARLEAISGGVTNPVEIASRETSSVALAVASPRTDADERVLDLVLRFFKSSGSELEMERQAARVAAVRGVGSATAATCRGADTNAAAFAEFRRTPRTVLPLPPFGLDGTAVATLTVDGGAPIDVSAAGVWLQLERIRRGTHRLVFADADGATLFDRTVVCLPNGILLLAK